MSYHNGMKFSSVDRDNDLNGGNCAGSGGPWWHNSCFSQCTEQTVLNQSVLVSINTSDCKNIGHNDTGSISQENLYFF